MAFAEAFSLPGHNAILGLGRFVADEAGTQILHDRRQVAIQRITVAAAPRSEHDEAFARRNGLLAFGTH